jgi:hypothetical protein
MPPSPHNPDLLICAKPVPCLAPNGGLPVDLREIDPDMIIERWLGIRILYIDFK